MLEKIFPVILDMTITGTVTVALVVIIRWIFRRRMPAIFRYALWGIVLIRLVVPFSIPSVFSIFNIFDATPYFENTIYHQRIQKQGNQYEYDETTSNIRHETNNGNLIPDSTANDALNNNSNFSLSEAAPEESTDLALNLMRIISWIWFVVATCLFISSLYAYFYATCKLKEAVLYKMYLSSEKSPKLYLKNPPLEIK